ncbi:hypothetical protein [Azospirillum sp. TSO35-2]|uniref:hypothetical protein n=1 Tax=Azospirillum sp. TSO35-2 TaxID=716796 RepID=UPI000D60D6AF|nr:hypothetical protein [Azospirillum sp. TSO35-2]PWC39502.1 hypothetical protein TSO352_04985 [Azospirillum sp. TSO35-2]
MIETIDHDGRTLAIIVRAEFREPGITFFTPSSFSQQLAFMRHPAGKTIAPHLHNPVHREVDYTQEVLLIRRGILRVDFYDGGRTYLHSRLLQAGDVILLASGGHGFQVIEEVEMVEVKQGPFAGAADKSCFDGAEPERIVMAPDRAPDRNGQ